jgi:purine-binding chemotaxis protein CheW
MESLPSPTHAPPQPRGGAVRAAAPQVARQYLTFHLGEELFAIDIVHIREIIKFRGLTEVPLMPGFLPGVINLRGAVVPVIDMAARLGRTRGAVTRDTCVVILEVPTSTSHVQAIGALVDGVSEVIEIPDHDIEPPLQFGAMLRPEFIRGVGKVGDDFLIVLDVSHVLSIEEMTHIAESLIGDESAEHP